MEYETELSPAIVKILLDNNCYDCKYKTINMLFYKLDEACRPINLNHCGASMRMLFVQETHHFLAILSFCNCETQTALFTHFFNPYIVKYKSFRLGEACG
jgi:hypothetical protein